MAPQHHDVTRHNNEQNTTFSIMPLSIMQSIVILNASYAWCHFSERRFGEGHLADCRGASYKSYYDSATQVLKIPISKELSVAGLNYY